MHSFEAYQIEMEPSHEWFDEDVDLNHQDYRVKEPDRSSTTPNDGIIS